MKAPLLATLALLATTQPALADSDLPGSDSAEQAPQQPLKAPDDQAPAAGAEVPPEAVANEALPSEVPSAPISTGPNTIQVEVLLITPHGALLPADAEVRLERRRQSRPMANTGPSTPMAWSAHTDAQGKVRFEAPPALGIAESDHVVARYRGVEVSTPLTPERSGRIEPIRIFVNEVTQDTQALSFRAQAALSPLDNMVRIEHVFRLENSGHSTIDVDAKGGIALPVILPAPFGEPATHIFPGRPSPNELISSVQPEQGRVTVERGELVYRGLVPPEGIAISVTMGIPYGSETNHTLGLKSALPITELQIHLQTPAQLAPRLSLSQPVEITERPSQGGSLRSQRLIEGLRAEQALLLSLQGTPTRHSLNRPLGLGLSLVIVAALFLTLVSAARRPEAP